MTDGMAPLTVVSIDGMSAHVGNEVEVRGWVYNLRSSGAIHFVLLRDGTGILQVVAVRQDLSPEMFAAVGALTQESSVIVRGVVREDRRAPPTGTPEAKSACGETRASPR